MFKDKSPIILIKAIESCSLWGLNVTSISFMGASLFYKKTGSIGSLEHVQLQMEKHKD